MRVYGSGSRGGSILKACSGFALGFCVSSPIFRIQWIRFVLSGLRRKGCPGSCFVEFFKPGSLGFRNWVEVLGVESAEISRRVRDAPPDANGACVNNATCPKP